MAELLDHDLPRSNALSQRSPKQQGAYVTRVIAARIAAKPVPGPFRYGNYSNHATIGRRDAVVDFGWIRYGDGRAGCSPSSSRRASRRRAGAAIFPAAECLCTVIGRAEVEMTIARIPKTFLGSNT